jgi:hypothetical protein
MTAEMPPRALRVTAEAICLARHHVREAPTRVIPNAVKCTRGLSLERNDPGWLVTSGQAPWAVGTPAAPGKAVADDQYPNGHRGQPDRLPCPGDEERPTTRADAAPAASQLPSRCRMPPRGRGSPAGDCPAALMVPGPRPPRLLAKPRRTLAETKGRHTTSRWLATHLRPALVLCCGAS